MFQYLNTQYRNRVKKLSVPWGHNTTGVVVKGVRDVKEENGVKVKTHGAIAVLYRQN